MQIEYLRLDEIHPYKNNPRRNDEAVDAVANSIKEYGFKQPIVVSKDGTIIAGHTRYKAATKLGLETVPCIIADDLTKEQEKQYRLVDNKTNENSYWDLEKLDEELAELNFDYDYGFSVTNFEWEDINEGTDIAMEYQEPEKELLKCPVCGAIDSKNHFRKVKEEKKNESIPERA